MSPPLSLDAISLVRQACAVPLIGFGGAPFTLAGYLVEGRGSNDFVEFNACVCCATRGWPAS